MFSPCMARWLVFWWRIPLTVDVQIDKVIKGVLLTTNNIILSEYLVVNDNHCHSVWLLFDSAN